MCDAKLHQQFAAASANDHVGNDVAQPVLQDRFVETDGSTGLALAACAFRLLPAGQDKLQTSSETCLGEFMKGRFGSGRAATAVCRTVVAEMVIEVFAPASNQRCATAGTPTSAG